LKITELLDPVPPPSGFFDLEIAGLTADSRSVRPGFLFAALPGTHMHGGGFAAQAADAGAVAILTDSADALRLSPQQRDRTALIIDANPARRLALLAARFYRRQPRIIAAVTGTNGKTSVVHFTREIWTALGHPAASLGTLGLVTAAAHRPGALTTPDSVALHRDLTELTRQGIEHVAIEASSHGLHQFRLDGVTVAAAAYTNLTRDHLDYHPDLAHYRAAKERLFTLLAAGGAAVLNSDSGEFERLAALCCDGGHSVLAYGTNPGADLRLIAREPRAGGQILVLVEVVGQRHELVLPLVGEFQAMNALAALGLVIATGGPVSGAIEALANLPAVPGRMQFVAEGPGGGAIVVDYAHTPDALATVLAALRPHTRGRLVVVFGCGGDRDPGKRPLMGEVATRSADRVYVTDDNPRSEPPADIRRAILASAPNAIEIGERREAIATAIAELARGDLLVIAGKGHETGQIIGTTTYPFDDAAVAREFACDSR